MSMMEQINGHPGVQTYIIGLLNARPNVQTHIIGLLNARPNVQTHIIGLLNARPNVQTHIIGLLNARPNVQTHTIGSLNARLNVQTYITLSGASEPHDHAKLRVKFLGGIDKQKENGIMHLLLFHGERTCQSNDCLQA